MSQSNLHEVELKAHRLSWAKTEYRLTKREREVLCCMAMGMSNSEIAKSLHIAIATAKVHVARILLKLDVSNRTKAALIANSKTLAYEGQWCG